MTRLFRQEATEHTKSKLYGDVLIAQPVSYYWLTFAFFLVFIFIGVYLFSYRYVRKEAVEGYLTPKNGVSKLYANRAGTIEKVYVSADQKVHKNDPLMLLRSEAWLPSGVDSTEQFVVSLGRELNMAESHLEELDHIYLAEAESLKFELDSQNEILSFLNEEVNIVNERLMLAKDRLIAREKLLDGNFVTTESLSEQKEIILEIEQTLLSFKRQQKAAIASIESTRTKFEVILPHRLDEEKSGLLKNIEALKRDIAGAQLAGGYLVKAPIDGYISNVLTYEGSSTAAGQVLVSIQPEGAKLIAKLLVPSSAIGLLKPGNEAKILFDAFPYSRFGFALGEVVKISKDIIVPGELDVSIHMDQALYIVDVQLESQTFEVGGTSVRLKSGMQLKADVHLEEKKLSDWILDPIVAFSRQ